MFHVELLEPAQYDLEEIGRLYLSLAGPDSARKITDSIFDALEQLQRFPLSGPSLPDAELRSAGYRYLVVKKYIVVYRVIGYTIVVYHIFDGRSDYPKLFRSGCLPEVCKYD